MKTTGFIKWLKGHAFVVGSAALGLVFAGLAAYRYSDAMLIDDETSNSQQKIESMRRNARNALTLGDDLKRLNRYSDRVAASLMNPEAKAVNLAYFYEVGSRCQVKVLHAEQRSVADVQGDKKVKTTPELTSFSRIQFDIGIEGPYASILAYVDSVRTDHPFMRVESLAIRPSTAATGRVEEASLLITVLTDVKPVTK
jgi:hypothetical protein